MAIQFLSSITITGTTSVSSISNDNSTYTGILVWDGGVLKYRTKSQILSDIGATGNTGTVTSVTVQGNTGLSGSGTITTSGTITLTNSDRGSSQSIYKNIASDSGTATANSNNDTLTIAGGTNVSTAIIGDTITITATDTTTNNYVSSLSWNTGTGVLTAARSGLSSLTVDLDGRYVTSSGVTSVATAGTVSGLTLTGGTITSTGTITLGGTLSLTSANVTTALGFTPYNSTNPSGFTAFAEPGIFSGGGTPTLASGVTGAEIRTLIGAGTSSSAGVTSVATTNGITGGTITGTGTIQLDSTVVRTTGVQSIAGVKTFTSSPIVPTVANNDDSQKVVNSEWVVNNFSNNQGDITAVVAGNKLTGGGTSGSVTLGLASNNISQWTNDSGYTTFAEPGIFSGGGTPTLASGVTAAEVRSLIGAGTSSSAGVTSVATGSGLTGGTITSTGTLSHSDTSTQSSVNNSGVTYIQDVTLDGFGHVTALASSTATLSGLGFTGATNANYITNNNQLTNGAGYTTNTGTVTSVGISHGGNAFNTGSAVTTSGTLGITMAGTASQYVNGAGNLITFPSIPQGDITAVVAGTGMSGGGTSGSVTLNCTVTGDTGVPAILSNGTVPSLNSGISAAEVRSLIGAGTSSSAGVTSVATGTGLTGGTITSTGTLSLATGGAGAAVYGSTSNSTKIDTITLDAYGRVTAVATGATGQVNTVVTGNSSTLTSSGTTAKTLTPVTGPVSSGSANLATGAQIQTAINTALVGVLSYQGTWNASTNSPTLSSGSGTAGYYYIVSVAGSTNLDGITDWAVGDWAVFSDQATDAWQKIDNTQVGNVTGSGSSGRVAYWNSSSNITSDAGLTFNGSTNALTVTGAVTWSGGGSTESNSAYDNMVTGFGNSGSSTKTLTLTQQDGGTLTTSFSIPQGTVTPSSTDTFTNKSGNISQWTNNSGYITAGSLPTVNNATITLSAGTGLSGGGVITLNQSSNETVTFNNTITNNNQLTNGAGYTTNTGDITSVGAGTFLTGGGTSGAVTLNVSATSAATASTLVSRDSAADISARLFRANYANQSTISGAIAFRVNNSSDNYLRYCSSPSAIRTFIGAGTSSSTGTVTSVGTTGTVSGLTLTGTVTTSGNLTLGGTLTLTSANVTGGLGFTPYNATNPAGYTTNTGTTTASNSQTFTNKGGNISQWTNDSGYTTNAGTMTGFGVAAAVGGSSFTISNGETLSLVGGTNITASFNSSNESITFNNDITNNNQLTNGAGYITSGSLPTVSNATITLTAGTGLTGGGTITLNQSSNETVTFNNSITNNNQLTNGAGYTTNTGTTTASNTQTFTNKSGNISQWSNNSGYTTNTGTTTASNTQTFTNKSGNISQWTNNSGYVTSSGNTTIGTSTNIGISAGGAVLSTVSLTQGVITAFTTRTMTLANLGYTGATNANYITNNNQLTNGAGYTTNTGDITGVTAGSGLSGGGTSGGVTINVDYVGSDSIVMVAPSGSTPDADDFLLYGSDSSGDGTTYSVQFTDIAVSSLNFDISTVSNWTVNSTLNVRGAIDLADNDILRFGTGDDCEMYFSGSDMFMDINNGEDFKIRDGNSGNATRFTFDADSGDFTATGNVSAYSDIRLKDNIETLDGSKVLDMRGVSYTKDGKAGSGVIAQELEKVAPELVMTNEKEDGIKSVAYGNLVGYLIEAVKEQQKQIDELKAKIDDISK